MTNADIEFVTIPNEIYKFNDLQRCKLCSALLTLDKDCICWNDKYYQTFAHCSTYSDHYNISYEWEDPKGTIIFDYFFMVEDEDCRYTLKIAFNSNGIINELSCHNINTDQTDRIMMSGKIFHVGKKVNEKNLLKKLKMIWAFR